MPAWTILLGLGPQMERKLFLYMKKVYTNLERDIMRLKLDYLSSETKV